MVDESDEAPTPGGVARAAANGDDRQLLEAMRDRIARAVDDPECPKRDLASLTLRLQNIVKELRAMESSDGKDDLGAAMATPDEPYDADAG